MQEMHLFDKEFSLTTQEKEAVSKIDDSATFEDVQYELCNSVFQKSKKYVMRASSLDEMFIFDRAFQMGEEYAEALSAAGLGLEEEKVALYGFSQELNVLEQLKANESPEDLALLIEASQYEDFQLMEFFDETHSFINYSKIKSFLLSKRG